MLYLYCAFFGDMKLLFLEPILGRFVLLWYLKTPRFSCDLHTVETSTDGQCVM